MPFPDDPLPDPATWFSGVKITSALIKQNIVNPINAIRASASPAPAWTPFATFSSGVIANSFGFTPAWWQRPDGMVLFRGSLQKSPDGSNFAGGGPHTLLTLPSAIVPDELINKPCATNYASDVTANTRLDISDDGHLYLFCADDQVEWVSLDEVWYYPAT